MAHSLYRLLEKLDAGRWHYILTRNRPDSVLVSITFVGKRVEVDVFDDGHMEVSQFVGSEENLGDASFVLKLIAQES